ncbi:MAG: prepilin-type N-terminal cleavage/methylation domain-containing protein [Candidatus Omnitrophica bacterium]|nr:prepilin-type N-terminal cleavage/methylation domain-containing protein [Candidatus Omnitrophota bacterium]
MRRGFTLIEIVLVAVVLVILLAATIPNFQGTARRLHLEQIATQLAQQLRYAREHAVAAGNITVWAWDAQEMTSRLYALMIDSDQQATVEPLTDRMLRFPPLDHEIEVHLSREADGLACPEQAPGCSECACLQFHPDGTVQNGSTVPAYLHITQDGLAYTIQIDASTGSIALSSGSTAR